METAVVNHAAQTLNNMNLLLARAAHEICSTDRHGNRVCHRESFFHRVGRWILTGFMIFIGLILLLVLCCCIRRHRKKKAKAAVPMQQVYAPPPPQVQFAPQDNGVVPVPPLPVDSKPR